MNGLDEIYKDYAIIVINAMYKLNRILSRSHAVKLEILQIKMIIAIINNAIIKLNTIKPIFNSGIIYTYNQNIASFNFNTRHWQENVRNLVNLIVYL